MLLPMFDSRLCTDSSLFVTTPSLLTVLGRRLQGGGAAGFGPAPFVPAAVETIERAHFYRLTEGTRRARLAEALTPPAARSFNDAFAQIVGAESADMVAAHEFDLVPAFDVRTFKPTCLPLVCVALGNCRDERFLPYRDSTGMAAHTDFRAGLQGAVFEFLERQCLVAHCLTGRSRATFSITSAESDDWRTSWLLQELLQSGDIKASDISVFDNCYVMSVIYTSRIAPVAFSIGCSAGLDPVSALRKALQEVCQGISYFHRAQYLKEKLSGLSVDAQEIDVDGYNTIASADAFPFYLKDDNIDKDHFASGKTHCFESLLDEVYKITGSLSSYMSSCECGDKLLFFFKIVSPDFLLSRLIHRPTNLNNAFYAHIGLPKEQRRPMEIPFY